MLLESTFLFMISSVALVGFFDDTLGDKDSQGFKGHIKELFKANITTGVIKLIGIPLIIACGLAVTSQENGIVHFLLDVVTVALFVNTFNLFDLSPGRTSKIALVVMLTIVMIGTFANGYYALFGMILACCIFDTKEKFMLGDTGSNVIGLIVGLGVVSISNLLSTVIICLGLFGLNILSEFVSFSKIINETMPLRVLDEIGQTSERIEYNKTKRGK